MVSLDPFLHEWDERFHAMVAKNMMAHPFKPMLHANPLLPYKPEDWCCNHVWLHKQPLFLWQMALSLKVFGVHTFTLRLPSAWMGALSVLLIFRIGKLWSGSFTLAFTPAFLFCLSHFNLELCSGRYGLEHNDLAFAFYVTAGIWAWCEYYRKPKSWWALAVGIFTGCAILVKWLTAFVVFGGWAAAMLASPAFRCRRSVWLDFALALSVCAAVFLPWQFYISYKFPLESAATYQYNWRHITENLGHPGNAWKHFSLTSFLYGIQPMVFFVVGLFVAWLKPKERALTAAFGAMIVAVYAFFSVVATKMPGLTYLCVAPVFLFISAGFVAMVSPVSNFLKPLLYRGIFMCLLGILGMTWNLRPWEIVAYRNSTNQERQVHLHNTAIYRSLHLEVPTDVVVLNCKAFEELDLMFWQPHTALSFYPNEEELGDLLKKGYRIAAFKAHPGQKLPAYTQNPKVQLIGEQLW